MNEREEVGGRAKLLLIECADLDIAIFGRQSLCRIRKAQNEME